MIVVSPNNVSYVTRSVTGSFYQLPYKLPKRELDYLLFILEEYWQCKCYGVPYFEACRKYVYKPAKIARTSRSTFFNAIYNKANLCAGHSLTGEGYKVCEIHFYFPNEFSLVSFVRPFENSLM